MAKRAIADTRQTFLVEQYRPGLNADELGRCAAQVRDAVEELERKGKPVRFLRSVIVPSDESLLCVLEADSEQLVREVYARTDIPFERISAAVTEEA
jgi:hypothetical protein